MYLIERFLDREANDSLPWVAKIHEGAFQCSFLALLAVFPHGAAAAAGKPKSVKYVAPEGFGGHKWGDLRSSFDGCPRSPSASAPRDDRAQENRRDFTCVPSAARRPIWRQPEVAISRPRCCRLRKTFRRRRLLRAVGILHRSRDSASATNRRRGAAPGGLPVLRELARPGRRKRHRTSMRSTSSAACACSSRARRARNCASCRRTRHHVRPHARSLLAKYGRPANFVRRGQVVIETEEGDSSDPAERKFSIWRWCPAADGLPHRLRRKRRAVARPRHRRGHRDVFDAAALGIRLRARKQRLQGRPAVPAAARAQVTRDEPSHVQARGIESLR